jgi:hypothetical protein
LNPVTYTVAALRQSFERDAAAGVPALSPSLAVTVACAALLFAASTASANRKSVRSFA